MANISENLSTVKQSLIDIKNAIIDKGITLTGNITTYAEAIDQLCLCGSATPLYIENVSDSDGVFKLSKYNLPTYTPNLIYRIGDNGEWFEYDITTLPSITVPSGSKIYLKGDNANGFNHDVIDINNISNYYHLTFSKSYNIGGYITSLLALDNFNTITDIPNYSFYYLFYQQSNLLNAEDLITDNIINVDEKGFLNCFQTCSSLTTAPNFSNLTTVGNSGFYGCFQNCISLTTAPRFDKVTTIGDSGFLKCFRTCISLTTAPRFDKVTTVNNNVFSDCFRDCSSLTTAPNFQNVTTVGRYGFQSCFENCSSLQVVYAPRITTWDTIKLSIWVGGVAITGVVFKPTNLEIPLDSVSGIPTGWSVINYVE